MLTPDLVLGCDRYSTSIANMLYLVKNQPIPHLNKLCAAGMQIINVKIGFCIVILCNYEGFKSENYP